MSQKKSPRRIGEYEILGSLGKGAMGEVYKAVQPSLNRIVALKVLPPEFVDDAAKVERFKREAQAVALLNHPNIVQIIDKERDGETLFFVMEYVQGSSLDGVLQQRRLSLQEAVSVFKNVCTGLQAAHSENIVHRDLNPRNILVSDDLSIVKLADFGISRVESISREMGTLSTQGLSMGSLHYMAPEQAVDLKSTDHRSDIYSAGVVLYEMLTGRVPVGRFSLPSQLNSEVPSEIDPIVLKCLASDPGDRYASVGRILTALAAAEDQLRLGLVSELRGISRSTSRILKRSTNRLSGRRKITHIGGGAALAIALLAGGYFLLTSMSGPETPVLVAESPRFIAPESPPPPPDPEPESTAEEEEPAALPSAKPALVGEVLPESIEPEEEQLQDTPEQVTPPPQIASQDAARAEQKQRLQVASDKLEAGLEQPALADLETFLEEYPDSPFVWEAYELMSQANLRLGLRDNAMASLVEFTSLHPRHPSAPEATYELGVQTLESPGSDRDMDARGIFADLINEYPRSQWVAPALAAKGQIEVKRKLETNDPSLGTVPAALVTFRQLTEQYPTNPVSEQGYWQLARQYEEIKDFDSAARAYLDLGNNFASTHLETWWEAGQILEKKLGQDSNALEAYRRVPATSENFKAAQRRIKKLDR